MQFERSISSWLPEPLLSGMQKMGVLFLWDAEKEEQRLSKELDESYPDHRLSYLICEREFGLMSPDEQKKFRVAAAKEAENKRIPKKSLYQAEDLSLGKLLDTEDCKFIILIGLVELFGVSHDDKKNI